ncbi:MAG: BT4734/BF3469 family protein [Candidatus Kapaibacterium sp.]|nr:DUF3987 domain-containing protein [Ignavibacteriota bacterium]MCB9222046.1 DUF3987 domain-containing protein [Ignavibacteria bacterium]
MKDIQVSHFKAPITHINSPCKIGLFEISNIIKQDKELRSNIIKIRVGGMDKTKLLDYVTFSGIFKRRRIVDLLEYSGLICLDIDNIENPEKLKQFLIKSELPIVMMFISPSEKGLKVVLKSCFDVNKHQSYFEYYEEYFKTNYKVQIDKACKDISRACFLSYDQEVYFKDPSLVTEIKLNEDYANIILERARNYILESKDGEKHHRLFNISRLIGGYSASNLVDTNVAITYLEQSITMRGELNSFKDAQKTIRDGFSKGLLAPLTEKHIFSFQNKSNIEFDEEFDNLSSDEVEVKKQKETLYSDFVFNNLPKNLLEIIDKYSDENNRSYMLFIMLGFLPILFPKILLPYGGQNKALNLGTIALGSSSKGKNASNLIRALFTGLNSEVSKIKVNGIKKTLLLPPNISASELIERLNANGGEGIINGTEITDFTNTNSKDYGSYDTIIRQGLSNETISKYRKTDNSEIDINFPTFSVNLTGTPSQLSAMFPDMLNGLYSRFLYFIYGGVNYWIPGITTKVVEENKDDLGFITKKYFHYLDNTPKFIIPEEVEKYFDSVMSKLYDEYSYEEVMLSVVVRSGFYTWKLVYLLKLFENDYSSEDEIVIDINTLKACLEITRESIYSAEYMSFNLKSNTLSETQRVIEKIRNFKREFTRAEAITLINGVVSDRTVDRILSNKRYFDKEAHGIYKFKNNI